MKIEITDNGDIGYRGKYTLKINDEEVNDGYKKDVVERLDKILEAWLK